MAKKKKLSEEEIKIKQAEKQKKEQEKQLKYILIIIGVIFAAFLITYFIMQSTKGFEYGGAQFSKTKQGAIDLYLAKFPIKDADGKIVSSLPFYFREDPRSLRNIKINGEIQLKRSVALTTDNGLIDERCEDIVLAETSLAVFIRLIGANPFPASLNATEASRDNVTLVSCSNTKDDTVIIFKSGNESSITKNKDCYTISVADCDIMNATERFMMGWYANSNGIEI